jgi:hypothetical protein
MKVEIKRKINIVLLIISVILFIYVLLIDDGNSNKVIVSGKKEATIPNALSIMLETSAGSGNYNVTSDTIWPTGYKFNENLSKCENGSTLTWDSTNSKLIFDGNLSDNCYIYFDELTHPSITSVDTSTTEDSITLKVNATQGDGSITKYYYSIDDGITYQESASSTYTFTGLTKDKTYNLKAYVVDSNDKESYVFSTSATAENTTVYWNDDFSGTTYAVGSTPATTYTSPTQVSTQYYIKTTSTEHEACLLIGQSELCLGREYQTGSWGWNGAELKIFLSDNLGSNYECYFAEGDLAVCYIDADNASVMNVKNGIAKNDKNVKVLFLATGPQNVWSCSYTNCLTIYVENSGRGICVSSDGGEACRVSPEGLAYCSSEACNWN